GRYKNNIEYYMAKLELARDIVQRKQPYAERLAKGISTALGSDDLNQDELVKQLNQAGITKAIMGFINTPGALASMDSVARDFYIGKFEKILEIVNSCARPAS